MAKKFSKLHLAAFSIETLAHTQGLEVSLLPQAEFVRKVNQTLMMLKQEGPISSVLTKLQQLAKENEL